MKKLTAEVARRHQRDLKSFRGNPKIGLSLKEELYLQALEIALPILEQQERGEGGWIEWCGGDCPVTENSIIDFRCRDGKDGSGYEASEIGWFHDGAGDDIIAYRIIPERATNQNGEQ